MDYFFREKEKYSEFQIGEILKCSEEKTRDIRDSLLNSGVLAPAGNSMYTFNFVGVFSVCGIVGYCYPKFFNDDQIDIEKFKLIIKAIRKCQRDKVVQFQLHNGNKSEDYNKISTELFLLTDYFDNGLYRNIQTVIEDNGPGEIDWEKTINETMAIIKDNRPYYVTMKTIESKSDDVDYFKRLHECVVTYCSNSLKKCGLLDVLEFPEVYLSEESLNDFGDDEFKVYRLCQELSIQFETRKRELLQAIRAYVEKESSSAVESELQLYGVSDFNVIWEAACGAILSNEYKTLKNELESWTRKPTWFYKEINGLFTAVDSGDSGLRPDIVSIVSRGHDRVFCVLDAKNYLVTIDSSKVENQPKLQDVIKQFVYHKELLGIVAQKECSHIVNAFLAPEQESCRQLASDVEYNSPLSVKGRVEMPIVMDWGEEWLVPVYLIYLSPSFVIKKYLENVVCESQLAQIASLTMDRDAEIKTLIRSMICHDGSADEKFIMVSHDKNIASRVDSDKKVLFFKRKKNNMDFIAHEKWDDCSWLLHYQDDGKCSLAKISPSEKKLYNSTELSELIQTSQTLDAQEYSVFEIENIYTEKDIRRTDLNKLIAADGRNEFLAPGLPKVIMV